MHSKQRNSFMSEHRHSGNASSVHSNSRDNSHVGHAVTKNSQQAYLSASNGGSAEDALSYFYGSNSSAGSNYSTAYYSRM
ncbi:hypothetical protein GGI08_008923 [Coemansia sp. S2]|nr:hypothetical protein GGI08_008923 [Coemansia sp. S2]